MRRFLCLWLPRWPTDRWRRRAEPLSGPLALAARGQGGVRLTAIDDAAAALGLVPGMGLGDARALVPELIVADAAPEEDDRALTALADWCARYSPWRATDGADGVRLDITGCAHLFGGEAALQGDLERRLAGFGVVARGAIADTPAAAWAWARYRPQGADAILAAGDTAPLLALPVMALRLEAGTVLALNGLGLGAIGAVAALPRGPLALRLGDALLQRLDQLFGRLAEPISPRPLAEPWLVRHIFAEPIGRREDIDAVTQSLAENLCRDLALKGQGARRLELSFFRVDGAIQRLAIGTSRATHEPRHLTRLFAERLESVEPGFGIEAMVLEATLAEPLAPAQSALSVAGEVDAGDLAALIDRLQNRLGSGRVVQLIPVESHVPERAERRSGPLNRHPHSFNRHPGEGRDPFSNLRDIGGMGPGLRRDDGKKEGKKGRSKLNLCRAARPVKLLAPPEPIEAMAPVPDDPPLSFRWRKNLHRVAAADGPERIGPEWWRPAAGRARDYYRVEDSEGRRFWVFREGLYGAAEPPRWFLHGFFA